MAIPENLSTQLVDAWQVLLLFVVPIGGGIPAGVVLAQRQGLAWPITTGIYFISDLILACSFEPLMLLFIHKSKSVPWLARVRQVLAESTSRTVGHMGFSPGPFSLIMITFGTDPMTGRSVARAAGHGFITGWTLTIMGDMIFFFVIMASTLWLNSILGDGTWTAIIITVAIIGVPTLIRRLRRPPKNS